MFKKFIKLNKILILTFCLFLINSCGEKPKEYTIIFEEINKTEENIEIKYYTENKKKIITKKLINGKVSFKINQKPNKNDYIIDNSNLDIEITQPLYKLNNKDNYQYRVRFSAQKKMKTIIITSGYESKIIINSNHLIDGSYTRIINKGINYLKVQRNITNPNLELRAESANNFESVYLNKYSSYDPWEGPEFSQEFDLLDNETDFSIKSYLNTDLKFSFEIENISGNPLENAVISVEGISSIETQYINRNYIMNIAPNKLKGINKYVTSELNINISKSGYSSENLIVTIPENYKKDDLLHYNIKLDKGYNKQFNFSSNIENKVNKVQIFKNGIKSKSLNGNKYIHSYKDSQLKNADVAFTFKKDGYKSYTYNYKHGLSSLSNENIVLEPITLFITLNQKQIKKGTFKNKESIIPVEKIKFNFDGLISQKEIDPGYYRLQFKSYNTEYILTLSQKDKIKFEHFEEKIYIKKDMSRLTFYLTPKTFIEIQLINKKDNTFLEEFPITIDGNEYKTNNQGIVSLEISSKLKEIAYSINNDYYVHLSNNVKIFPGKNEKKILLEPLLFNLQVKDRNSEMSIPSIDLNINNKLISIDDNGKIILPFKNLGEEILISYKGERFLDTSKPFKITKNNLNLKFWVEPLPGVNIKTHYDGDTYSTIDGVEIYLDGKIIGKTSEEGVINYKLPERLDKLNLKATKNEFETFTGVFNIEGNTTNIEIPLSKVMGRIIVQTGSGKKLEKIQINYLGTSVETRINGLANVYPEKLNTSVKYSIIDPSGGYKNKEVEWRLTDNKQELQIILEPIPTILELSVFYEWSGAPAKGFLEIKPQPDINISSYQIKNPTIIEFYESSNYLIQFNIEYKDIFIKDSLTIPIIMNGKAMSKTHSIEGSSIIVCANDDAEVAIYKIDAEGFPSGEEVNVIGDCNTSYSLDDGFGLYRFSYKPENMDNYHIENKEVDMPNQVIDLRIEDSYLKCLAEYKEGNLDIALDFCGKISDYNTSYCKAQKTMQEIYISKNEYLNAFNQKDQYLKSGMCTFKPIEYVDLLENFKLFNSKQWEKLKESDISQLEELLREIDSNFQRFKTYQFKLHESMKESLGNKIQSHVSEGYINGLKLSKEKYDSSSLNINEARAWQEINDVLKNNFENFLFHIESKTEQVKISTIANQYILN